MRTIEEKFSWNEIIHGTSRDFIHDSELKAHVSPAFAFVKQNWIM